MNGKKTGSWEMRKTIGIVTAAAALLLFWSCGFAASPQDLMIGKWVGDPDFFLADPELSRELKKNPFAEMLVQQQKDVKLEFTRESLAMSVNFLGQDLQDEAKYRIVSTKDKDVVIESTDKNGKNVKRVVTMMDDSHLKIIEQDDPTQIFVLKRVKQ
jgi:hypothetical protein